MGPILRKTLNERGNLSQALPPFTVARALLNPLRRPAEYTRVANQRIGKSDQLPEFGIRPEDELFHLHSPSHEWWSESYFWDWLDDRGEQAGHCRIAVHPNQKRAWLSLYIVQDGQWIAIDEPRLPLEPFSQDPLRYTGWGLELSSEVEESMHSGKLRVAGWGRVMHGPRAGSIVPIRIDLAIAGIRPPHLLGSGTVLSANSPDPGGYETNRYQQLITVRGTVRVGPHAESFEGVGARDHSWGPRSWNMEWETLSLHGPGRHIRASVTRIPNVGRFASGHIYAESLVSVVEVDFRLKGGEANSSMLASGSVAIKTEDGALCTGTLEPISAVEIDISHTDVDAGRTRCTRTLLRFVPDGPKRKKRQPLLGWLETNRFSE